jgi:hypothetical protein
MAKHEMKHAVERYNIIELAEKWQTTLGLGWLSINHRFSESFNDEPMIVAETEADWEYRQAKITWFLPRVAGITREGLEEVMVHELVHCLTAPIESELRPRHAKQGEFAVESIARAILSMRDERP